MTQLLLLQMGAFLDDIRGRTVSVDGALLNCSQSKLIEYYSSYKSICEGFTMNVAEYTQIFGGNQVWFAAWDLKGRGRLDAIELFAGLVVFSRMKYQQKIKFLFEMFDFNEEGFLPYQSLAFLLLNVCNATYKLFALPKHLPHTVIESFLDDYFTHHSQVHLPHLLRWTIKNTTVLDYFRAIGYEVDHQPEERRIDTYSTAEAKARQPKPIVYHAQKELRLDLKLLPTLEAMLGGSDKAAEALNLGLQWVFGVEAERENVRFVRVEGRKAGNQRIVYSVGKIVVIFFPKLNQQRFYKGHTQPISVIEVSRGKLAVSAEKGEYPCIHLWDLQSQLNLFKFRRIHKHSIKFMKFFRSDKYLITASQAAIAGSFESPVVVLKLDTKEVVMSTYLKVQLIGIWAAEGPALLLGRNSVTHLSQNERAFSVHKCEMMGIEGKQIVAYAFIGNTLITAHTNRQLCRWDEKYVCTPLKYESLSSRQILQLVVIGERLLVLDEADVEIVWLQGDGAQGKNMVGLAESRLYNLGLKWMQVIEGGKLLVASHFGDLIKVSDIQGEMRLQKYYQLFRMQQVSDAFVAGHNNLLFLSGRFIYLVDRHEKQLKVLSKYDFEMTMADLHRETLVVVTALDSKASGLQVISLGDFSIRESYRLGFVVEDVKVTENYVVALSQNFLSIFHRAHQRYFQKDPFLHKLAVGKQLSFARQHDHRSFFILNDVKELFKLTLTGAAQMQIQKVQPTDSKEALPFQQLTLAYPQPNYKYPLVVCPRRRLVTLGRKNGDMLVWESLTAAFSAFSSHTLLSLHADKLTRMLLVEDQLFSVGSQDGMIAHFIHRPYLEQEEQSDLFEQQPLPSPIKPPKVASKENQKKKTVSLRQLQGGSLREGQVEVNGLMQPENAELKEMIQGILVPTDKLTYLSQVKEVEEPLSLALQLESVYGMEIGPRSIHYLHSYPATHSFTCKTIDRSYWEEHPDSSKEQMQYAKGALTGLDEEHLNCRRQVLYCCDRVCVLQEKGALQQLYPFHRRKVTAVAVHPNKQLVCSCQLGIPHPQLHLWNHQQRTNFLTLNSRHRHIISKVQFSADGEWIVTLGGSECAHSIQVFHWQNEETVAFRCIEDQIIRDILFNPYDRKELCCAGQGIIRIYRVEEDLIIKEECSVLEQNFTAIAYTSNVYGSDIESDVITGSLEGDIGLYVCGSFLYSRKKAHERGVTCLKLVELFQYKRALISGGGDGYVRIWDIKFNQISRKNIRDELYSIKNSSLDMPDTAIVSIDIYHCLKKQSGQSSGSALMLIATSDGSVLQATVTNQFQGYRAVSLLTAETQALKEKINFDVSLSFTAPPSHGFKSLVCNNLLLTYSPKSKFLYFWNLIFRTRQKIHPLQALPLFMSKMKTKSIILAGLQQASGPTLKMFELEWSAGIYLRSVTLCGEIELQKGNFVPRNAQFSTQDNKLAVRMKNEDIEEVWLYDKTQGPRDSLQYVIRLRIEEKNATFTMRISWCEFSTKEDGLMVAWQECKGESEAQIKYKCYDCNNGNVLALNCFGFDRFDFSAKVKASYLPCFTLNAQNQKDYLTKDSICLTMMTHHGRHLLMGTASGQVLIVETELFGKKETDLKYYAKCMVVADSPITMLQTRQNDLIVSSDSGEAVYVLKMKVQKCKDKGQSCKDPASESITAEDLDKKLKEIYLKRKKIENEGELGSISCGIDLKLAAVIGRNAFYKRNNIFIDLKDNIISFSGCNLLIMKHEPGRRLTQRIIKPDLSSASSHPEISCIALGDCKRLLLVGTSQQSAKIIAWDISTNTNLFDIKLNGFITINLLKLSFSGRHAIVLATAKNAHQYLLFIDLDNRTVLAVHHFHKSLQINDLSFFLGQQYRMLACGAKYMAEWSYCNSILSEKMYSFNSEQEEDIKNASIIFYSLIFIDDYAISSGSDGYLYIWKDQKVVKRQNAHPNKEPILSLYTSINSKIFVSGASNGTVIIWHFSSSLIIQKLDQYSVCSGKDLKETKDAKFAIKYQVQSICMTKQSLIVGNRAGQIVHFPFSVDTQKGEGSFVIGNKLPLPILSGFNHESIKSCAFNTSSRKLYVVTESEVGFGTFSVFDLTTFQKIKQEKMNEVKSPIICMLACKLSSRIFIVQKNAITTFSYQAEVKDDKFNKLVKSKMALKCQLDIKTAVINNDETFLAVLVAPGPLQNAKIDVYALTAQDSQFYIHYMVVENLQASIDVIDFCTDHEYLVYQGADDEQTIIDLMTKEKIKAGTLENPPEWNQQAKRTTPSIKEITTFYSEENKLLKVVQLKDKGVIATDEIGSVRVFAYPITANKDQSYQVYIEHLNHIYICVLSPDNRMLVTVSREDRAIHIWDLIYY